MITKKETIDELNLLRDKALEYKRNIKIGSALTAVGIALDFGIANSHVPDLSALATMAAFVVVPGSIVAFNANDYRQTKKRINKIKGGKVLKKGMIIN